MQRVQALLDLESGVSGHTRRKLLTTLLLSTSLPDDVFAATQ
jgi:hypothetical protein